jgi:hypothetical protein
MSEKAASAASPRVANVRSSAFGVFDPTNADALLELAPPFAALSERWARLDSNQGPTNYEFAALTN